MTMKQSFKTGFGFGLTSGIITTLGLIVGLNAGTHSKVVVLGGILVIAIADAFSDALGIHVAEESDKEQSRKQIWEATVSTFLSKFLIALTFIIPILFMQLSVAIMVSVLWGLFLIGAISFYLAKQKKENPKNVILEHLFIAVLVIIVTNSLGNWVATFN
jgi:VIT1/CCC1 family predicted Fe2+/Mn2+ transporter